MEKSQKEKTLTIVKPDGIQRSLVGEIIKRYERLGLKIIALKMLVPKADFIEKHYTIDSNWRNTNGEKTIKAYKDKGLKPPTEDPIEMSGMTLEKLKKYMSSGPVIVMVWEGAHAVQIVRKITGGTEPLTSDVGTIRGDFVMDSYQISDPSNRAVRNLIHASGSVDEAKKEINLWFKSEEIIKYNLVQEHILYDVNLDGILE
ncbi:nucleoside-diphosphate kinase [Patescibacteria group bacterium]